MTTDPRFLKAAFHAYKITGMSAFGTASMSKIAPTMQRVIKGDQSHCGIIFHTTDHNDIYMEALFRKGVVPPKHIEQLFEFLNRDEKNRLWIVPTKVDAERAQWCFAHALEDIGTVGYHEAQLLYMWAFERILGRFGLHPFKDENSVVCSEWMALVMNGSGYDLRDDRRRRFDEVNPVSGLKRVCEINKKLGLPTELEKCEIPKGSTYEKDYINIYNYLRFGRMAA